ncbi:sensor histidine kinase [Gracilimonas mengyeensis]|uniref:histidine kinase n=1 Tax=Gracilimonas mengyeensis TaxID=1302730 RepID=A0A521CIM8_9BACT|nr:HAMP domain-containing sensor histidine kinase [Gracilimonas mengyeensis]SMO59306.1 Signal transduction histidine kinase [Gracilimonas mengyeensis]
MNLLRNRGLRWILLMIGLAAIIALTGMNVLSLYDLRDQMVEGERERRISQLDEISQTILNDLRAPLSGFYKLEMETVEPHLEQTGQLPPKLQEMLHKASQTAYFNGIYYTPEGTNPCDSNSTVYQYNKQDRELFTTNSYPNLLCDGVGLVRTKTKIQLNDFDYRWNNNLEFDTHRSMNVGLINLSENRIVGYLTFTLNKEYIVNEVIDPLLDDYFGDSEETGVVVWLHDWTNEDVLASNDSNVEYDRDKVDHRYRFSYFFDTWSFRMAFLQSPVANAYNATLFKNLAVLGVAVLFLLGALIFMFITAQRERNLAQRQASFLANVTHELKTPLAVMQAAGENISDGRVTEPKRLKQYGEHIYNESIRLRGMIEKLLDVARVDSGQAMLKAAPYRLNELLESYLEENLSYIEGKGFTVRKKIKEEKAFTMIDRDSFETIISNLTENAIKYSSDVKFIEYQISSDDGHVYLSVTDHGIGIPKKAQKNIFNKFYRVEDSDTLSTKVKGHGLGLSIVKNMVNLNGGSINVKSTVGRGTTFIVRFPKLVKDDLSPEQRAAGSSPQQSIKKRTEEYVG